MTERAQESARGPDVEAWNRQVHVVRIFDQLISTSTAAPATC
jgi:hypothetical protein